MGNPLSYYNGITYTFSWTGRRLTAALKDNNDLTFTYNDEGIRTAKTVNGVTTTYYLSGSTIIAEETEGNITVYLYDSTGSPIGMQYHDVNYAEDVWDVFWYEKNLQGDIVAVYDSSGMLLIEYNYSAYGRIKIVDYNADLYPAVYNNPFRYRGYYYDKDLDLYYLNARYYDRKTGRFISPDAPSYLGANGDLNSYNLYAYCSNNPVMYTDPEGNKTIAFGISGGFSIGVGASISIGVAFDDKGNIALQYASAVSGLRDEFYLGVPFGLNAGGYLAHTELEKVKNLTDYSTYLGASVGSGLTLGADAIFQGSIIGAGEDAINPKAIGKQYTFGVDATPEIHIYSSETFNVLTLNVNDVKESIVSWINSVILYAL